MVVIWAGIHRMLVRMANKVDPDQTASDLGLPCLSRLFKQATNVQNFRTFTLPSFVDLAMITIRQ